MLKTGFNLDLDFIKKMTRYVLVGVGVAGVYSLFYVFFARDQHVNVILSDIIAVTASSIVSYLGHHYFTFSADGNHAQYVPRFAVQVTISYSVSAFIVYVVSRDNLSYLLLVLIVWIALPIINFLTMQLWTFVDKVYHHGE